MLEQLLSVSILLIFLYFCNTLNISNNIKILLNCIVVIESIVLISSFGKVAFSISIFQFIAAIVFYAWRINPEGLSHLLKNQFSLDYQAYTLFNLNKSVISFLGIVLFLLFSLLEIFFFDGVLSNNTVTLLIFSFLLISYNYVPDKFSFELNFMIVFLAFIIVLIVMPRQFSGLGIFSNHFLSSEFFIDSKILVNIFLARPLAAFLTFLGYNVYSEDDFILFEDSEAGILTKVLIGEGCSGIYSFLILIAAIFSYAIASKYNLGRYGPIIVLSLLLTSYLANLFRMSTIVLAGHYFGYDTLVWVHANFGSLLFVVWFFIYWKIMVFFIEENVVYD